ncbi:hypothetical protein [Chryseobacterium sp. G0186]|uniref:hypothetical protein n=1 Tax=Chryseobacterium sp. G0186 TaxID=2487064 RepID=UPI000F51790A|nr:hypothetical protein [Chryseobacterium sp. G0186]
MSIYYILAASFVSLLLLFILYSINKGIPSSHRVISTIEESKDRLEFNDGAFIIDSPLLQQKQIIEWKAVEAIYCLNMIPLDGTYHNFEYSFFLNKPPVIVKYSNLKWYNRLFSSSESHSFEVKIDDYNNIDFNKIHQATNTFLLKKETSSAYLHKKFGNNIRSVKKNDTITSFSSDKPLKTFELYQIYDRGNTTQNDKLKEYRDNATKI